MLCVIRPLALLTLLLAPVLDTRATNSHDSAPAPKVRLHERGIRQRVPFVISLNVSDDANATILNFGIHPDASSGFDAAFDLFAPPPPPGGAFDARIRSNGEDYLTQIKKDSGVSLTFNVVYQPASGSGTIVLSWDPTSLAGLGTFEIFDNITGTLFGPLDMSSTSSLEVATAGGILDGGIKIRYTPPAANNPPQAQSDNTSTDEDSDVVIDVLANDSADSGLNPASVIIVDPPAKGTITSVNSINGSISFTPEENFNGSTDFTYTVSDNDGVTSQPATVTITVNPVNDPPEFTSTPLFSASENTPYSFTVRTFDVDGDLVIITADLLPSWLTLTDHSDGTATLSGTPGIQQQGLHNVTLNANDGQGASVDLSFSINVIDNASPVAISDLASTTEDEARIIDVLSNDSDPEGDDLDTASITIVVAPANGTIVFVNPSTGAITYMPEMDFSGIDQFSYTVADIHGGVSNAATVEISVSESNDLPVAAGDAAQTLEDTVVLIDILTNDTDPENGLDASSVSITRQPIRGVITGVDPSTGVVTYEPAKDIFGADSFSYTVRDLNGGISNEALVQIQITPDNDAPRFSGTAPVSALRDEPFDVLISATDVDGDQLSFVASALPQWLALSDNANNTATISGLPSAAHVGSHTVTIEARDPFGSTDELSFTVTVSENAAPTSNNDSAVTSEDTGIVISVLLNDNDPEGDALDPASVAIVNPPSHGSIESINALTGAINYRPQENYNGPDTFSYVVSDIAGNVSKAATVVVTITPVDDAPVATDDSAVVDEDQSVVIDLRSNDFDVDGDLDGASINVLSTPSHGSIIGTEQLEGTVTYLPANNFFGQDQFLYQIIDSSGMSSTATVTIEVNPVNDAVEFISVPYEAASPGIEYLYNVEASDPDEDTIVLSASTLPDWLLFSEDGPGRATISGTPTFEQRGIHNVILQATDGNGSIVHQSFVILISENAIPEGEMDIVETNEDVAIIIDVLLNDFDPNNDALDPASVTVISLPSKGVIQGINPFTGAVRYLPNNNFFGFDEFTYTVADVLGGVSNVVRVEITIHSVNDIPIAALDVAVTEEDLPVIIPVLFNDFDADIEALTVVGFTAPSSGSVTSISDGSFLRYVPDLNFNGVDNFTYTITDPNGGRATGNVTVHILPLNDPSEFTSNPETAAAVDAPYNYSILAVDLDGDQLDFSLATQPAWTTFTDHGDGTAVLSGIPSVADKGTHRVVLDVHDGTGTVRQIFSIIVGDSVPAVPPQISLVIPATGTDSVSISPRLSWEAVPGANTYHIQVAAETDILYTTPVADEAGLTDLEFDVPGLEYGATYRWRIRASNASGTGLWSEEQLITTLNEEDIPRQEQPEVPAVVTLYQNYPNPFNPQTLIPFDLSKDIKVTLTIFDMLGRRVGVLVDRTLLAGRHEINWDAGDSPSGLYIVRLRAGATVSSKTLSLIR